MIAAGRGAIRIFRRDDAVGCRCLRASHGFPRKGCVLEYDGREVKPMDNGYLSQNHAEYASQSEKNRLLQFPGLKRKPLRASKGHPVSQLWYARQGIVTPEMEFIAIRENMGREMAMAQVENKMGDRRVLNQQHPGQSFGAKIPGHITPEFVRDEVARGRAIIPVNIERSEA